MEPPPFGDGNIAVVNRGEVEYRELQWSHRLSAMETTMTETYETTINAASMEPPPFGDGNFVSQRDEGQEQLGFNGATAFRRWKRELDNGLHRNCRQLQWSHRLSAMETACPYVQLTLTFRASMEPPPFGDGNQRCRLRNHVHTVASMEPPPFGDGNGMMVRRRLLIPALQWSHRLSAMETDTGASMEPPPFGDGN